MTAFSGPADAGVNPADLEARRAKPLLAAIAGRGGQDHQERTAERPARPFAVRGSGLISTRIAIFFSLEVVGKMVK